MSELAFTVLMLKFDAADPTVYLQAAIIKMSNFVHGSEKFLRTLTYYMYCNNYYYALGGIS